MSDVDAMVANKKDGRAIRTGNLLASRFVGGDVRAN